MSKKNATKAELLKEVGELRHRLNRLEESRAWLSYIEEQLLSAEQEKAHLLNTIVEPIVYLDQDLQILWSNQAASDSLHLTPRQAVEKSFLDHAAKDTPPDLLFTKAMRNGSSQEGEVVSPDGRVWHLRVYPVQEPQGGITGLLAAFLDITARKRAEEMIQNSLEKLQRAFEGVVQAMSMAMEIKDLYTSGHQQRVAQLACAVAAELKFDGERIEGLRVAGLLHDLGKIAVASEILSKPGKINEYEIAIIKAHPQIGYDILKTIEFPWPVAQMVLQHHERLDGSGYPAGLKGEEIMLEAKILGVADVVEAMSSHRPYRPAIGINQALEEISQKKGLAYAPEVVDACLRLFHQRDFAFK
jgi:putative nucleotidyltransferase with HDIG domain/PAS domain S-box-containing protein